MRGAYHRAQTAYWFVATATPIVATVPSTVVLLAAVAATIVTAGCGSDPERGRVTGSVDLSRPSPGAPDAGTAAGHGNDEAMGAAQGSTFAFTGHVEPPDSAVRVETEGGRPGAVVVEQSGRFSVAVDGLRRGPNAVRLVASRPGHRPWSLNIRVTRGSAPAIAVPERDTTPPIATLRVQSPGTRAMLTVSPSMADDRLEPVRLAQPVLVATALARDDDGGTGRARVTSTYETRCGGHVRRITKVHPPAQIGRILLTPGTDVPAERSRTVRLRLDVGEGCSAEGDVLAEATNAHDLQAVSRHIRFHFGPAR
jgi:hypothetical protein